MPMKECVACAEQIQENAKLCRYCNIDQSDKKYAIRHAECAQCGAKLEPSNVRCPECNAYDYTRIEDEQKQMVRPDRIKQIICSECNFSNFANSMSCARCHQMLHNPPSQEQQGRSPNLKLSSTSTSSNNKNSFGYYLSGSLLASFSLSLMIQLGGLLTNKDCNWFATTGAGIGSLFTGGYFGCLYDTDKDLATLSAEIYKWTSSDLMSSGQAWALWFGLGLAPFVLALYLIAKGGQKSKSGNSWFFFWT